MNKIDAIAIVSGFDPSLVREKPTLKIYPLCDDQYMVVAIGNSFIKREKKTLHVGYDCFRSANDYARVRTRGIILLCQGGNVLESFIIPEEQLGTKPQNLAQNYQKIFKEQKTEESARKEVEAHRNGDRTFASFKNNSKLKSLS
jgi:hypothetical protein